MVPINFRLFPPPTKLAKKVSEFKIFKFIILLKLVFGQNDVLQGLSQGRSIKEITASLKLYNKYYTFYSVSKVILNKLEAFTLPHAISKAIKMKLI